MTVRVCASYNSLWRPCAFALILVACQGDPPPEPTADIQLDVETQTIVPDVSTSQPAVPIRQTEEPPQPDITQKINRVCGACHGVPEPGDFTDRTWNQSIRYKYWLFERFYSGSAGGLSQAEVLRHYQTHAAQKLPPPKVYPTDDPRRPRFGLRPLAGPRGPSLIASIQGDATQPNVVQVTDMLSGRLETVDLSIEGASPELMLEASHPTKSVRHDFNGDGRLDHLVFELSIFSPKDIDHGRVRVFLSDGSAYRPQILIPSAGRIADGALGDVDGDGIIDAVIADFGWQKTGALMLLSSLKMTGDKLTFQRRELDTLAGHVGVALADMDGDGDLDLVDAVSQHHERIQLWENDGQGRFTSKVLFQAHTPLWGMLGLKVVDLDGDGDQDILHFNGDTLDAPKVAPFQGVHWLRNDGADRFTNLQLAELPGTHSIDVADFDGDGRLDIIAVANLPKTIYQTLWAQEATPDDAVEFESVILMTQSIKGQFFPHSLLRNQACFSAVYAVDRDGDGDQDLVLGPFGMGWSLFGQDGDTAKNEKTRVRVCDQDQLLWLENLGRTGRESRWTPRPQSQQAELQREIQALQTITQNDPKNVTFRINLGNALTKSGRAMEANAIMKNAVQANPGEALTVFQDGCAAGTSDACTNLGVLYFYGDGVPKDLTRAATYYRRACEGGEGNACANLAMMYQRGQGAAQDTTQAIALLRKACGYGHSESCGQLGELHARGEGVSKDLVVARRLLNQGCAGGDSVACQSLAGMGAETEPTGSGPLDIQALEAGCRSGRASPCRLLADRYAQGRGVPRDMVRAVQYAEKGCLAGDADACGNAGGAYLEGVGVPQDAVKGQTLLKKACSGGSSRACAFLERMGSP